MLKLVAWEDMPQSMKNDVVKNYYEALSERKGSIALKRIFDLVVGVCTAIVLLPVMLIIAVMIKTDSKGPVFFKQERVTTNGKRFRIFKFRTMVVNAEALGTQVTTKADSRITRVGKILRKVRLDELPQIFNLILGDMSFVGTRPEVPKYVDKYTPEMMATLLLPAGITSMTSILYKDEEELLSNAQNADDTYVNVVLSQKMRYNLKYLWEFNFVKDIQIMLMTVLAVCGKDYSDVDEYQEGTGLSKEVVSDNK